MPAQPTFSDQDYELLSAYIDGQLTTAETAALETRLEADAALRGELAALRQTVALVRELPVRRAPRNFTLTPAMAGTPRLLFLPTSAAFSALSAVAAMVLVFAGFALLGQNSASITSQNERVNEAGAPQVAQGQTLQASATLRLEPTLMNGVLAVTATGSEQEAPFASIAGPETTDVAGREALATAFEPQETVQFYNAIPSPSGMGGAAENAGGEDPLSLPAPLNDSDDGENNGFAEVGALPPQPSGQSATTSSDEFAISRMQTTQEGAADTMMEESVADETDTPDTASETGLAMIQQDEPTEEELFDTMAAMEIVPNEETTGEAESESPADAGQQQAPSIAMQPAPTNIAATPAVLPTLKLEEPTATLQPSETPTQRPTATLMPTATVTPSPTPFPSTNLTGTDTGNTLGILLISLGAVALVIAVVTTLARRRR